MRFETAVGNQIQADWVEFRKRKEANLFASVPTRGYSSATYVEFVSELQQTRPFAFYCQFDSGLAHQRYRIEANDAGLVEKEKCRP